MSVKESVISALEGLSEAELQQVSEYLAFLKFRARAVISPRLDATQLAALYGEGADEDRRLAEEGMGLYHEGLLAEDHR